MLQEVRFGPLKKRDKPKNIIVFLHGLGSNNQDLISLAPEMSRFLPDSLFVSINAPYHYEFSSMGYQWFSLKDWDENRIFDEMMDSYEKVKQHLEELIQEFVIPYNRIYLIGFSQGAMVALHTGLRLENEIGGVIALSGRLIGPNLLKKYIKSYPPIMLSHGMKDEIVPYIFMEEAKTFLELEGVKLQCHTSIGGHGIDTNSIKQIIRFLTDIR